jgi:hypothetical protein
VTGQRDDRPIAEKLADKLQASDPHAARRSELRERIALLKQAQRPGEALSDKDGVTAAGHIASAITKLVRVIQKLR